MFFSEENSKNQSIAQKERFLIEDNRIWNSENMSRDVSGDKNPCFDKKLYNNGKIEKFILYKDINLFPEFTLGCLDPSSKSHEWSEESRDKLSKSITSEGNPMTPVFKTLDLLYSDHHSCRC